MTFDVTAIAVQKYQHLTELDGVGDDAQAIVALLSRLGGVAPARDATEVVDKATAEKRLSAWWSEREQPSSMLLWIGHGRTDPAGAALACYDTRQPIAANGLLPQAMAGHLRYDWDRREPAGDAWALVIVEADGADDFVDLVNNSFRPARPHRLCLIGVAGPSEAYAGRVRRALEVAIGRLTSNQELVPLGGLVEDLRGILGGGVEVLQRDLGRVELRYRPELRATICAPADVREELIKFLATAPADLRNHFFTKARAAEHAEFSSYFVGRRAERSAVRSWLETAERGLLIVTGRPGCGKSALLGDLLLRSDPRWRALLDPEPAELTPPDDAFDAAVHLALLETGQVVRRLAESLGAGPPGDDHGWSGADMDALVAALAGRRFTVLVDGLDEAVDPIAVASTVLRRLAELPGGRVVVGTRPSTGDAVDRPPRPVADLLDALSGPPTVRLELPRDPAAIGEYATRRLAGARAAGKLDAADVEIDRVAALVGGLGPERDFLFARLVVFEVLARPALLRDPELETLAAGDHRSLFRAAVDRLAAATPAALPLLEALAQARGRGVPRIEGIWATMATALGGGTTVTQADIDELLRTAAPYILVDAEYEYTVYRLAHQTYRSILTLQE